MRQVKLEIHTIRTWNLDDEEIRDSLYHLGYTDPTDDELIHFFVDLWKGFLATDDLVLDHIHGVIVNV